MRRAPALAGVLTLCTILVGCGEAGPTVVPDPESDMVDIPGAVLLASAGGQRRTFGTTTTVLYVNFDGAQITKSSTSDATTNSSFIGGGTVPPFDGDQATRDQVVALVTQLYDAYNIQIVTSRPASGDYDMALVGGTPADLGLTYSSNVAGVAPMDCDDKLPRDIAFIFSDSIKALTSASKYAQRVAETTAHESGHTYGLPHSDVGCDLMSYSSCAELKTFLDQTMPMQSDSYGKCGLTTMNSHQLLLGTLGPASTQPPAPPADTEAPKVAITSPAAGAKVGTSVTVKASISDDTAVTKATLLADGQAVKTLTSAPWELTASLAAGPHTLVVEALDAAGNKGSASVAVTVEAAQPTPPPGGGTEPPPSTGDTQAPKVTIVSPAEGASVATTLTVQATIVDDTAVARADLLVDGQLSASRTAAPFDFQVTLTVGKHTLRVEALDAAGNKGSGAVTVNVDPGLPVLPGPTAPTPPTPGAFGASCESSADCHSGLCAEDPEVVGKYCTETCDPAANMCPDRAGCYPSTSSVSVCGRPTGAPLEADGEQLIGGCSVGRGADGDAMMLLLVLVALPLAARQRVRGRA